MLGAIIGDIVGSRFELHNIKNKNFEFFTPQCHPTDDSIMTLSLAQAILNSKPDYSDLSEKAITYMQSIGRNYPHCGYSQRFCQWIFSDNPQPYKSYGNGAAMRVSPAGFSAKTLEEAKLISRKITEVSHNHPEGIKGAEAVAAAIYMAKNGSSISEIRSFIDKNYYPMNFTLDELRRSYSFDATCQRSVPPALMAFFESTGFEDAVRNAVSIGGDSDTLAAICGGIAEAYYGIPSDIRNHALTFLDDRLRQIIANFEKKYISPSKTELKIYAFEVRDDERTFLSAIAQRLNIKITCSEKMLTLDNIDLIDGYTGITVLGQYQYDKKMLNALKTHGIFYLATRTIGYNHIDIEYARQIGIHVCNVSYEPNSVAEYTVMMILLCLRHYKASLWRTNVNDFSLAGLQGRQLKDLTVGILGTGRIGRTVLHYLASFGCRLLAYNSSHNEYVEKIAEYVDLDTLYKECDIISLHLPLSEKTYHLINKDSIAKMKQNVVIINCARGGLMKIEDLIEGIENKKIGALGLDCMEYEEGIVHQDLKTDIISNREMAYLRQFPNVVHTPHMAFYTDAAVRSMVFGSIEGIFNMYQNKKIPNQLS